MTSILSVQGLDVRYGQKLAVKGASMDMEPGTITTIIGANGAGKTSFLAGLAGLVSHSGRVVFDGHDTSSEPPEVKAGRGMILVAERRELFGSMSVVDNLMLGAVADRASRAEIRERLEDVFGKYPRLKERWLQRASTLSGGERQMLALGRALMGKPRLLMLDEPSLGLAPNLVNQMFDWISQLRDENISILLVEQNARLALEVATHAHVMNQGTLSERMSAAEMLERDDIAAQYFGRAGRV